MLNDTYIRQVRAALWGEPVVWPEEETEGLLRLHAMQGTGALVYPSVLADSSLSSNARVQMKGVCLHTMQTQAHMTIQLKAVWQALEKAGIRPVLMKGAGLAAYYPSPEQRQWGDIDLFVGKEQYHPACAAIREAFPKALKFDEELDHYKHYNIIADGVSIETHRVTIDLQHPIDEKRYEAIEKEGMAKSELFVLGDEGLEVRVPEKTYNALLIMLHSWEHVLSRGANMRQLCDLALLLNHTADQIDKKRLERYLRSLHLMDVWQIYAYILTQSLGLPLHKSLFYSEKVAPRARRLLEDLLAGRLKVSEEKVTASGNRFVRKWRTMKVRMRNADRIVQYSPAYGQHMKWTTILHGVGRLFAKDRKWE